MAKGILVYTKDTPYEAYPKTDMARLPIDQSGQVGDEYVWVPDGKATYKVISIGNPHWYPCSKEHGGIQCVIVRAIRIQNIPTE